MRHALISVLAISGCVGTTDVCDTDCPDTDDGVASVAPTAEAGADLEVPVGVSLELTSTVTGGDATWDLGDGAKETGAAITHAWSTPGNYVVVLTVVSPGGRRASDTTRVTVYRPAAPVPPVASSTIAVDAVHQRVWVVLPETAEAAVIDLVDQHVDHVTTCEHPRTVAVDGDRVAIACESDAVAVFDAATFERVGLVALDRGSRPYGVVGQDGAWFVSAQGTGALLTMDEHAVVDSAPLGADARALVVGADGAAYASRFRSTDDHGEVLTIGAPIALDVDPGPDSDTTQRGVPTSLHAMVASPDGGTLYIGATLANTARGTFRDGEALTFETAVRATLRVIDLASGLEDFDARKQFDNHGQVTALALAPRGNWLYVGHGATQTIARVDAYTLRSAATILDAGHGLSGLAVTPDGRTLLVHAWLDRELRAYDISDPSVPSPPLLWTAPTVSAEPLAANVLAGKKLFYDAYDPRMARDGYATCAVCHPDGRDDGITWDFTSRGEGLRNTISLEGRGGTAMGPVHWTGNFDEIQDFENDIRNGQGGHGLLTDAQFADTSDTLGAAKAGLNADLDALAAYVDSLTTTPPSPFAAPADGAARFAAKGCATCHSGESYTDSALDVRHDIGTIDAAAGQRLHGALDGFDTPTLLGAWATGPYLHDGSALTVEEAITRHAQSDIAISAEDIEVIAGFVRSL